MSAFAKTERKRKFYFFTGLLISLVFTNPLFINHIYQKWEYPLQRKDQIPLVRTGVVLGGMIESTYTDDQYQFSDSNERILESIILVQSGLLRNIIISGGSGAVFRNEKKESVLLEQFAEDLLSQKLQITIDSLSRNTHENAIEVAKILEQENLKDQPVLLITSAFHMNRSLKCFAKQGINCIPYPVDYKSEPATFNPGLLVPSAKSLVLWELIIKEWVGIGAYKIFGYV